MGSKRFLGNCVLIVTVLLSCLMISSTQGYKFSVGGNDGWVISPSESYNHWAERNRFQVNDTLYFKYRKGSDSVLLVTKEDYYSCNTKSPIQSLTEGDSVFTFDRSGPFFFITGNADNCNKGQKLIVVVMAVRHKPQPQYPPSPSPSSVEPATPPPVSTPPPSPTTTPAASPKSGEVPSDMDAPVPAPAGKKSGSLGLVCSSWLILLGSSIWVSIVLVSV